MTQNELAVIPGKPPAPVTQAELQKAIDLQNRVEILAADIRRRLEAGADFERGPLGASIRWRDSLRDGIGTATETDSFGILDIEPADRIKREREQYPEFAHKMWV
jgi:hypothetical protein